MQLTIQRTGGFTGIPLTKTIDAGSLSASEISHLHRMVETAHFFQLPEVIPSPPRPDRFEYQITIEREGVKHSVTVAEHAVPAQLKPLVDWMMQSGRLVK